MKKFFKMCAGVFFMWAVYKVVVIGSLYFDGRSELVYIRDWISMILGVFGGLFFLSLMQDFRGE